MQQTDLCSFTVPEEVLELQQRTVSHVPNGKPESLKEAKLCLKRVSWRKGKTSIFLKVFHKNSFNVLLLLPCGGCILSGCLKRIQRSEQRYVFWGNLVVCFFFFFVFKTQAVLPWGSGTWIWKIPWREHPLWGRKLSQI